MSDLQSTLANSTLGGDTEEENLMYIYAHGTVMVLAWMIFASTAVLFARYGRTIHFASKEKLLGEKIWFQIHRLVACLTTVLTLLGFFFILVFSKGTWVDTSEDLAFVHSVLGGIIVCCALLQAWNALFRCHPKSSFRYIFNWIHRLTGLLAFFLSVPTIFIIISNSDSNRNGMIVILSIWSAWVVIIVVILEIIRFVRPQQFSNQVENKNNIEMNEVHRSPTTTTVANDYSENKVWNNTILILFMANIVVSIALAIPLIVLLWG